jgi:hypothetical protein
VHQHTQAIWENESIEVNHGVKVNSDAIVGIKLYEQLPICTEYPCFSSVLSGVGSDCEKAILMLFNSKANCRLPQN